MSLAERLSSKFHICPRSFASRPNVHFSDNLSVADIIREPTYQPPEGVYLLNIIKYPGSCLSWAHKKHRPDILVFLFVCLSFCTFQQILKQILLHFFVKWKSGQEHRIFLIVSSDFLFNLTWCCRHMIVCIVCECTDWNFK